MRQVASTSNLDRDHHQQDSLLYHQHQHPPINGHHHTTHTQHTQQSFMHETFALHHDQHVLQDHMQAMQVAHSTPQQVQQQQQQMQQNRDKGAELYKTELCRKWMTTGSCRYGTKCQFAHGENELRRLMRHPLYKTSMCKSFQATGACRYGSRCRFIHNETDQELNGLARSGPSMSYQPGSLPNMDDIPRVPSAPGNLNHQQDSPLLNQSAFLSSWDRPHPASLPRNSTYSHFGTSFESGAQFNQREKTYAGTQSYNDLNGLRREGGREEGFRGAAVLDSRDIPVTSQSTDSSYSSSATSSAELTGFSSHGSALRLAAIDQQEMDGIPKESVQTLLNKSHSQPALTTILPSGIPEHYAVESAKREHEELSQAFDSFHIADLSEPAPQPPPSLTTEPLPYNKVQYNTMLSNTIPRKTSLRNAALRSASLRSASLRNHTTQYNTSIDKDVEKKETRELSNSKDENEIEKEKEKESRLDFFRSISNPDLSKLSK